MAIMPKINKAVSISLPSSTAAKPLNIVKPEDMQLDLPPNVKIPTGPMVQPKAPTLKPGIKPTPLQNKFVKFIDRNDGVGINAGTAGSGKTLATILSYMDLRNKGKATRALVVVPASLRENFAKNGVNKFTNAKVGIIGSKTEIEHDPHKDPRLMGDKDFYVISYAMFKKDPNKYLGLTGADTVIADEMHRMKDPKTKLHQVIKKIRPNIRNFIGASATPSMNNPFESVSLINAISKNKITPAQFQKEFYNRSADGFKDWFFGLLGNEKHGKITGWKNKERLGKLVGSMYQFSDKKLEGMPEKEVSVVRVPMSSDQTNQYKRILDKKLTKVERRILEKGDLVPEVEMKRIVNKVMAARQRSNNSG